MRFTRLPIAALALAAALTACSGDDPEPESDDPPATSVASEDPDAPGAEGPCAVEVEVEGAVTASWQGPATARVGDAEGPEAIYQAAKGDKLLMAYSEGPDFPPSVTVTVGKRTFANEPGSATGLDIGTDRQSAAIDITAFDVDGEKAEVVATFDCSGGEKDEKDKKGKG